MSDVPLRVWADLDLDALTHNYRLFRDLVPPAVEVVGVVKADAYGHGAVAVGRHLKRLGVRTFGIASVEEAAELRAAGLTDPIWHLGVPLPEEAEALLELDVVPTAATLELVQALARLATAARPARVHLKLDTGMGRRGGAVDEVRAVWSAARASGRVVVEALSTHFATADHDPEFARRQLAGFRAARAALAGDGYRVDFVHLANGVAALTLPEAWGDAIRPGLAVYGIGDDPRLRPVMAVRTRLCQVRTLPAGHDVGYAHGHVLRQPTRVGLAPVGYGDGWNWRLGDVGQALVQGCRVPYLGRVNMDMIQLGLNNLPGAGVGDEVTLLGGDGGETIRAEELAGLAGTSPYTVPTCLTRRVTRRYLEGGREVARRGLNGVLTVLEGGA